MEDPAAELPLGPPRTFEELYARYQEFSLPWTGFGPSPVEYFSPQELNIHLSELVRNSDYPHLPAFAAANTCILLCQGTVYFKTQDMKEQRGKDRAEKILRWSRDPSSERYQPGFYGWQAIPLTNFLREWNLLGAPKVMVAVPEEQQPPPGPHGGQSKRKPPRAIPFWQFYLDNPQWCNCTGQRVMLFMDRPTWLQDNLTRAERVLSGRRVWPTFRPFLTWFRYPRLRDQLLRFGYSAREIYNHHGNHRLRQYVAHLHYILCDSKPQLTRAVLCLAAQIIQHPGKLTERIIQAMGAEGAGKTTFFRQVITKVFGPGTAVSVTRMVDLTGQFSGHKLSNSPLLIHIDEQLTERDVTALFNNLVSAERYTTEHKHHDPVEVEGGSTVIFSSNSRIALLMGSGKGRRFVILPVRDLIATLPVAQRKLYWNHWDDVVCTSDTGDLVATFLQVLPLDGPDGWLTTGPTEDLTCKDTLMGADQWLQGVKKGNAYERSCYWWYNALEHGICCKEMEPPKDKDKHKKKKGTPLAVQPRETEEGEVPDYQAPAPAAVVVQSTIEETINNGKDMWEGRKVFAGALYKYACKNGLDENLVPEYEFRRATRKLFNFPVDKPHNYLRFQLHSLKDCRERFGKQTGVDMEAAQRELDSEQQPGAGTTEVVPLVDLRWAIDLTTSRQLVPLELIFPKELPAQSAAQQEEERQAQLRASREAQAIAAAELIGMRNLAISAPLAPPQEAEEEEAAEAAAEEEEEDEHESQLSNYGRSLRSWRGRDAAAAYLAGPSEAELAHRRRLAAQQGEEEPESSSQPNEQELRRRDQRADEREREARRVGVALEAGECADDADPERQPANDPMYQ